MKVKCVFNCRLPRLWAATATTLYPVILFDCSREEAIHNNILAHEYVDVLQVRKLGWLRFYLSYLWQYLRVGYWNISYEEQAYAEQSTQPAALLPGDYL